MNWAYSGLTRGRNGLWAKITFECHQWFLVKDSILSSINLAYKWPIKGRKENVKKNLSSQLLIIF